MGLILPENNFLSDIRKITKENNVPLIFDEVVTGFRVSPGGAQKHFGIKPDITTLGKALGNGFTIAAVGGKKKLWIYFPLEARCIRQVLLLEIQSP